MLLPSSVASRHDRDVTTSKVKQKPAETAAPKPPPVPADDSSPAPLSKRKQRSAQRLLEFQAKKSILEPILVANSLVSFA